MNHMYSIQPQSSSQLMVTSQRKKRAHRWALFSVYLLAVRLLLFPDSVASLVSNYTYATISEVR